MLLLASTKICAVFLLKSQVNSKQHLAGHFFEYLKLKFCTSCCCLVPLIFWLKLPLLLLYTLVNRWQCLLYYISSMSICDVIYSLYSISAFKKVFPFQFWHKKINNPSHTHPGLKKYLYDIYFQSLLLPPFTTSKYWCLDLLLASFPKF